MNFTATGKGLFFIIISIMITITVITVCALQHMCWSQETAFWCSLPTVVPGV